MPSFIVFLEMPSLICPDWGVVGNHAFSLICFPWICWKTAGICWKSVAWYVTDAGKTCYLTNGKSGFNYYCTWIVFLPLNCRNLFEIPSFIVFLEMPSLISAFALQGGICWKRLPWSVLIGEWLETIPSLICVPWSLPLHWRSWKYLDLSWLVSDWQQCLPWSVILDRCLCTAGIC